METKTLSNTNISETKANVPDVEVWGDGDAFKLISKASSESQGWMKSTKAYDTGRDVIMQVTTQQKNPDGSYAVAEALTCVPNHTIVAHHDNKGVYSRSIVPR